MDLGAKRLIATELRELKGYYLEYILYLTVKENWQDDLTSTYQTSYASPGSPFACLPFAGLPKRVATLPDPYLRSTSNQDT
jgi:hypothetical protein